MDIPSGRIFGESDINIITLLHQCGSVVWSEKPRELRSGRQSHLYVRLREDLTDNPLFERACAEKIYWGIKDSMWPSHMTTPCLIGVPSSGTALAHAVANFANSRGDTWAHRVMREVPKDGRWLPPPHPNHQYIIVDNTLTTGGSLIKVRDRLVGDGYNPSELSWSIFINRGGLQALVDLQVGGCRRVNVTYALPDILHAFGELDFWPKERVQAAMQELSD